MTCTCPQATAMTQTIAQLATHEPAALAKVESYSPPNLWLRVYEYTLTLPQTVDGEPLFKPRPFGNLTCYLLADWSYAENLYLCSLISDPAIRASCEATARSTYCEAFDLCGDSRV